MKPHDRKASFSRPISYIVWPGIAAIALIVIHLLFKLPAVSDCFSPSWGAGDVLGYCGSIIGALAAIDAVVLTLRSEGKNRREDVRNASKPLLAPTTPPTPKESGVWEKMTFDQQSELVSKFIDVNVPVTITGSLDKVGVAEIAYPGSFSEKQRGIIKKLLSGGIQVGSIFMETLNNESRFIRVEFLNVGVGPAVNLAFSVVRDGAESRRVGLYPSHTPTRQLPVGSSVSLGILVSSTKPSSGQSDLVVCYEDRDGRRYLQRHSFDRVSNGMILRFDLNIQQELVEDR